MRQSMRQLTSGKIPPLVVIVVLLVIGGLVVLMSWDPPAPQKHVEKNIDVQKLIK